jgi:hypothetical protein
MAGKGDREERFSGQQQGSWGQQPPAGGATGSLQEKAGELAATVAGRAGDAWDTTTSRAREYASTAATGAEDAWNAVSGFFGRYPLPMFLVGIGLGFLLAKALDNLSTDMTARMSQASDRW